jgi:chromate transport protein ChrA
MPTGNLANWRLIFNDDFTTNLALGSFPGPYAQNWTSYTGVHSTDGMGWYDMYKVCKRERRRERERDEEKEVRERHRKQGQVSERLPGPYAQNCTSYAGVHSTDGMGV